MKYISKFQHNHNYFSEWNITNAWLIGFIVADGNIDKKIKKLRFNLSDKDTHLLEYIRDELSPDHNILYSHKFDKTTNKHYYGRTLDIYSAKMIDDLAQYHIIPQKTGREQLPDFPSKDIAYRYLLGLFDGDGCVGIHKQKDGYIKRSFRIASANKSFLENIQEYFEFPKNKIIDRYNKFGMISNYSMNISDKQSLVSLYHNLYDNGGFCLQRKKDIFTRILESYED